MTEYKLAEAILEIQDDPTATDLLYLGGPVGADTVTMLMRSEVASEDVHHVFNDVYFSTSIPVLKAALNKLDHEERMRVYAGHAGWGAGQLRHELRPGDWHLVEADAELIFNAEPERIWRQLIRSLSGLLVQAEFGTKLGEQGLRIKPVTQLNLSQVTTIRNTMHRESYTAANVGINR